MKRRGALNRILLAAARVPGLFLLLAAIFLLPPFGGEEAGAGPLDIHTRNYRTELPVLPEARGPKDQSCAGSIAFTPAVANPGDLVTITVTIAANAEAVGRVDITTPGGTVVGSGAGGGVYNHWWTVPASANGNLPIGFVAYPSEWPDLHPPVICSGAASLNINTPAPVLPLSVSIGGDTLVVMGDTGTWTATVSGGVPRYTFAWNLFGLHVTDGPTSSTTSTQQRKSYLGGDRTVAVTVIDLSGQVANGALNLHIPLTQLAVSLQCTPEVEVGAYANYHATVTKVEPPFDLNMQFSDGHFVPGPNVRAANVTRVYSSPGTINLVVSAEKQVGTHYARGAASCSTVVKTPSVPCGSGWCPAGTCCCPGEQACCNDPSHCCGDYCCQSGVCCDIGCCRVGYICCWDGGGCCLEGDSCCGGGCCPAGTYCCGGGQCCKE